MGLSSGVVGMFSDLQNKFATVSAVPAHNVILSTGACVAVLQYLDLKTQSKNVQIL